LPGAHKKSIISGMVKIRLSRFGRKNGPFYRIVAIDSRLKTTAKYIDLIGTWNPIKKIKEVNSQKLDEWVKKGAQISVGVKKILELK